MPQVDLRPLFNPPRTGCSHPEPSPEGNPMKSRSRDSAKPRTLVRVTLVQLTNIGFVLIACLGALISAVYFFKGGELLQEVAAWPRELFYGRPTPVPKPSPPHDPKTSSALSTNQTVAVANESGDPFSPTRKLLSLDTSPNSSFRPNGSSSGAPFSTSQSLLNGLNTPAPGGDTLSRSLTQTPSLAQASAITAKSAMAGAQTTVGQTQQRATAQAKSATVKVKAPVKNVTPRKAKSTSQKTGSGRAVLGTKPKIQSQISHGASALTKSSALSSGAQSGGSPRSIAPAGHPFGGAGAAGMGMTGAHSFGRMGGR
jgi:hypothetical protein